jgi:hypothetical protein
MTAVAPGVTVGRLLRSRPKTPGLDLEILAGFHHCFPQGRVLVFGDSYVRYLERLDIPDTGEKR